MKKVTALAVTVAVAALFATAAIATSHNVPRGPKPAIACSFGTCFVPSFGAVGASNTYAGPAAGRIEFADCCIAGDKYRVSGTGPAGSVAAVFKSAGTLDGSCDGGPWPDSSALELTRGVTKVKYTAILLPGGVPAAAYIRMSSAGWVQTSGSDACGF